MRIATRLVHLDMKGAPPRPDYLCSLFPLMKQWGATGLCIEWEDMLPYEGHLAVLRHRHAYSRAAVKRVLRAARDAGLDVVPLVQTFGHVEFLLKHPAFHELQEDPDSFHDLCPAHPQAAGTMRDLLDQVLDLHPGVSAVHLGADEVWALGRHPETQRRIKAEGKAAVFCAHMLPLAAQVQARGARALIWDDMLRGWPDAALRTLAGKLEAVVWRYGADIETGLPPDLWSRYVDAGLTVWGASAFKGACAPDAIWSDFDNRALNHAAWIERARVTPIAGLVLTGWSRHNHFAALSEVLPVGLPPLALALAILQRGAFTDDLRREIFTLLGIGNMPFIHSRTEDLAAIPTGTFPGADVFRLMGKLQGARQLMWFVNYARETNYPQRNGGRIDAARMRKEGKRAELAESIAREVEAELPAALRKILFPSDVRDLMSVQVRQLIAAAHRAHAEALRFLAKV